MVRCILHCILTVLASVIMVIMGYDLTTWQWWAIIIIVNLSHAVGYCMKPTEYVYIDNKIF